MDKELARNKQLTRKALDLVSKTFNSNNRALIKDSEGMERCCYYTGPGGPRCAIGILVTEKQAKGLQSRYPDICASEVWETTSNKTLKKFDPDFLEELQWLHDAARNWNEQGLSERGKVLVSEIKLRYSL